jgi:hypothetical protein
MRWLLIREAAEGLAPFVCAELVDEAVAKDQISVASPYVVLSDQEACLDPDFSAAFDAWRALNDSLYDSWLALEDAERAMSEVEWEQAIAEAREDPPLFVMPHEPEPDRVVAEDKWIRCWQTGHDLFMWLFAIEKQVGREEAGQIARMIAGDLGKYSRKRTGVKTL